MKLRAPIAGHSRLTCDRYEKRESVPSLHNPRVDNTYSVQGSCYYSGENRKFSVLQDEMPKKNVLAMSLITQSQLDGNV